LAEAPFRSCIGGSDCSSRTYLTKALDPNYQYFTLTDAEGYSSGHITVVLGSAPGKAKSRIPSLEHGSDERKLAFIDKIQNVPHEDLPIMISNAAETREFVKRWIRTENETIPDLKLAPKLLISLERVFS
jgi:hypothetical protein